MLADLYILFQWNVEKIVSRKAQSTTYYFPLPLCQGPTYTLADMIVEVLSIQVPLNRWINKLKLTSAAKQYKDHSSGMSHEYVALLIWLV